MDIGENCYLRTARKDWRCHGKGIGRSGSDDCPITIKECVDSSPLYSSGDRIPCARVQLGKMVDWTLVPA